jgi:hypothetical protein
MLFQRRHCRVFANDSESRRACQQAHETANRRRQRTHFER